jgi:hypothetical protein
MQSSRRSAGSRHINICPRLGSRPSAAGAARSCLYLGSKSTACIGALKASGFGAYQLCNFNAASVCSRTGSLLDVGALRPDNYATCAGWIEVLPIDLRSRVAGVQEQDFLLLDLAEHAGAWDTIALSLVLNFVPSPTDRGARACRPLACGSSLISPQDKCFA